MERGLLSRPELASSYDDVVWMYLFQDFSHSDADRQAVFVNEAVPELCGYPIDSVIGQNPGQLLQGEATDPSTVKQVRQKLASGVPFGFSITNYHLEGNAYDVGIFVIPMLAGDDSQRFDIGICREVDSLEDSALDKRVPEFSRAVSNVLELVRPG